MVFSSVLFVVTFLPAVLAVYYMVPRGLKNSVLLLASLIFYAWGEPVYVFLMLYSIVFNYVMGIDLERRRLRGKPAGGSLALAVAVNLFLLGFFKYYGFLADNLQTIFGLKLPEVSLALPVGLSFYTFQALSYLADVYWGKVRSQKNLISFGLYIAMFPQLVAGPIVQYSDIDAQLREREMNLEKFGRGSLFFIWGLSKKVLLANNMGQIFEAVSALPHLSTLSAWVGVLAYAFQIYFDFSGYSDMAVGLGSMFGFELKENFAHPYCARSITEFWRRWHISLGAWFREYVYIPLGGNRCSVGKHIRNLLIVWGLTGFWHGAGWNFVVWGLYYGVLLILEKYVLQRRTERLPVLGTLYTLFFVLVGWVFFFSPTLSAAGAYLGTMFGLGGAVLTDRAGMYYFLSSLILFWLGWMFSVPAIGKRVRQTLEGTDTNAIYFLLVVHGGLFLLSLAYLIHDTYNPFLYFRF